jgi:hypothetical protein
MGIISDFTIEFNCSTEYAGLTISVTQDYQLSRISGVSLKHIRYIGIVSVPLLVWYQNSFVLLRAKKKLRGLVRQRTIPTERPPLVGEVNANFSGERVSRGRRNKSPRPLILVL